MIFLLSVCEEESWLKFCFILLPINKQVSK